MSEDSQHELNQYAKAVLYGLVAMTLLLLLFALYYLVQVGAEGAETRKLIVKQNRVMIATSDLIAECAIPPEERKPPVLPASEDNDCYERSLRQQGEAVDTISSVSIVAAACGAANPGDVPATRMCVERTLKAQQKENP